MVRQILLKFCMILFVVRLPALTFAGDSHITSNPYALQKRHLLPLLSGVGRLTFSSESNNSHNLPALYLRRIQQLEKNSPEDPLDYCTGFLVGERLVGTAAHCMRHNMLLNNTPLINASVCPYINFRLETDENLGASQYQIFQSACSREVYFDLDHDLALIELEDAANPSFFTSLKLSANAPQVGETLFQLSLYRDFIEEALGTMPGHINACQVMEVNQNITPSGHKVSGSTQIECEWPTHPGESGSPLVNESGEVVGIMASSGSSIYIGSLRINIDLTEGHFSPIVSPEPLQR